MGEAVIPILPETAVKINVTLTSSERTISFYGTKTMMTTMTRKGVGVGREIWRKSIGTNCTKNTAFAISRGTKRTRSRCDGESKRRLSMAKVSLRAATGSVMSGKG